MENEILKDILIKRIIIDFDLANNQIQHTKQHFLYKAVARINFFGRNGFNLVKKFNTKQETVTQIQIWKKKINYILTNYKGINHFSVKTFIKHNYYNLMYTIFHNEKHLIT